MDKNFIQQNLHKACKAEAPQNLMLFSDLNSEIEYIREYLSKKFNNLEISEKLKNKIDEINFSDKQNFDEWFNGRINFYKNKLEEMTKYDGEIIKNYKFSSETFKILNKCSWWVQNAYQPYSRSKDLLRNLDHIAACFEKDEDNKKVLNKKAERFCGKEKDWRGKTQKKLDKNEREIERQIFSFFTEIRAAGDLAKEGFKNIKFLPEDTTKVPDLTAKKTYKTYYIEVKRLQSPRDENEALRSFGIYSSNVNEKFRDGLKKKIDDFIYDAKEKFSQYNAILDKEQNILILDFEPGIDARLSINFNPILDEIFGKDYFNNLCNIHNLTIWTRKYF